MLYQLPFPFENKFPTSFQAQGIITPRDFMKDFFCDEAYDSDIKTKPRELQQELDKFAVLLGKDQQLPTVVLHSSTSQEYFPENFMPQQWIGDAIIIQDQRKIYQLEALKRDGTKQKIMIKGPKRYCRSSQNGGGLSSITGVKVQLKDSVQEFSDLVELLRNGVTVEKPLGYFKHGEEQWVYTEFVDGENPLNILNSSKRKDYFEADALLLASLYRSGFSHQGFATPKFDDKIWKEETVFLIDTDETYRRGDNSKENIPRTFSWELSDYLYWKTLSLDEALEYTKVFLEGVDLNPKNAEEVVQMTLTYHKCKLEHLHYKL
ncbi:MAG: hypothetical protein Q8R37_01945 [Nanoarchaeota archaeon]|nr:hypothetical protein [Nanoarchaeota archaeon]